MNIEALPKILFVNEENQQMQDRRIRVKVQYDTSGTNPVKKTTKKINNTIPLTEQLSSDLSINSLAYSNKLGLLITCIQNQILITDSDHLESLMATSDTSPKSLKKVASVIDFSGKIYLAPDQTKFLALNQNQFMLFDLNSKVPISRGPNEHNLRHVVFATQNSFAGWNFHSGAYLYQNISESISNPKPFEGVSTCTSVNVIGDHLIVFQKINPSEDDEDTQLMVFDQTASNTMNEFTLGKIGNSDSYIFNFTQVISIFAIKRDEKPQQFSENDQYGLVLAYYDDFQSEPDRRYVSFLKGNLLKPDAKLQIRAFDLFLSPTQDRTFYYDQNQQKIPFEVQIISTKSIKVIMIEHHEIVFVVDCRLPFDKLNLYTLQPAHEIKLQDKKYFKGICLMKNMLDCERKPPVSDSNSTCDMICRDFEGEFMSLYFAAKETELTVRFPESLLILGDNTIFRRYAVQTYGSIEEDKTEEIKKRLTEIFPKQRVYRIENRKKIISGDSAAEPKKSQPAPKLKQPQKQKVEQKPKEQEKKAATLFGGNSNVSSLFQNMQLGTQKQSAPGSSLFGAKIQTQETSLFGKASTGTSLFDAKPSTGGSIFDKKPNQSNPIQAGSKGGNSLFDNMKKPQNSLFAQKSSQPKEKTETKPALEGLFGNAKKQQKNQQKPSGEIFGKAPEKKGQGNLFSSVQTKQPAQNFLSGKTQQTNLTSLFNKPKEQNLQATQTNNSSALFGNKKPQELKNQPIVNLSQQEKPSIFQPTKQQQSKPKLQGQKKQIPVGMKPKQSQPKPLQKSEAPKVEAKKEPIVQKKPINLDKLKQLGSFFGHTSTESIPAPLMNLTDEQIDALIAQMSLVMPKKEVQPKTRQQIARQKILKEEHLTKIVDYMDETKNYLKNIKQANELITSPTMFTLKNAQQIVKSTVQSREKPQEELKSKNQLSNLVKNYAQRMQFLQKRYLNLDEQVENRNPNNHRQVKAYQKIEQQNIVQGISEVQQKIQCLMLYEQKVFTDKRKIFSFTENTENLQQKLTNLVKSKTQKYSQLCKKVNNLRSEIDQKPQKPLRSGISSVKSSLILTIATKQNKKKSHFAFSLQSSGQSDEQLRNISEQKNQNHYLIDEIPKKTSTILIKFKPKPIDMTNRETKNFTPLVKLSQFSVPLHKNNENFNAATLFAAPVNSLQNSMKKSVNFKDKIPLKKNEQQKIKKIMKFGESEDFENSSRHSDQEADIVPGIGRSISKIHPQGLLPRKEDQKSIFQQPQKQSGLQIKKTNEFDVPSNKGSQELSESAVFSMFGGPTKKTEQKQEKKQKTKVEESKSSLFGGVTNSGLFGSKGTEEKSVKIEESKNNQSDQAKKGSLGLFEGKKIPTQSKSEAKVEEKPATLFGNVGSSNTGSLFGASLNFGSKAEDKPKGEKVEKKEQQKPVQVKKQQPKADKKQAASLFGGNSIPVSGSLFGTSTNGGLFTNAPKTTQQHKPAQTSTKPSETVPKSTQKISEQPKKADEPKPKQEKIQQKKPSASLFGNENKNTLFGNNTSTLFAKKQEPKSEQPADSKPKTQQLKKAPAFGSGGSTGLFGSSGGLFASNAPIQQPDYKPKTQTQQAQKPAQQQKLPGGLFGLGASNEQNDKQEKKTTTSLNFNVNKQSNIQPQSEVAPTPKPSNENPPVSNQQTTTPLFGNNPASGSLFNQPSSNPSGLGGLFAQSKPVQTFGATSRFMAQESQAAQPQQTQAFNPNALSFGGDGGFGQSANTGMKSFSSFSGNQSGGLFGQTQNNQDQGQSFGSLGLFGGSIGNSMGQQSTQPMFGSLQSGQGAFGNQKTGLYGGMNQQQGNQGNFLSGFNPNVSGMSMSANAGSGPNASMFKARK